MVARGEARDEDEALIKIVEVFGQFMQERLRSVDAATEIKILESQDRAFDEAPELMRVLTTLAQRPKPNQRVE
jgi:hypothetical protein